MKRAKNSRSPRMLKEYDFSKGVRGKYLRRYRAGINLVMLAPDLAKVFPDSKAVNQALRDLVRLARRTAA